MAEGLFGNVQLPGALSVIGAAIVLIGAAIATFPSCRPLARHVLMCCRRSRSE